MSLGWLSTDLLCHRPLSKTTLWGKQVTNSEKLKLTTEFNIAESSVPGKTYGKKHT